MSLPFSVADIQIYTGFLVNYLPPLGHISLSVRIKVPSRVKGAIVLVTGSYGRDTMWKATSVEVPLDSIPKHVCSGQVFGLTSDWRLIKRDLFGPDPN